MAVLLVGPLIILLGVGAVFFVLRRKRVEKRSMYSARRQQIEHKVKSARQRTLAPHGHAKAIEQPVPDAQPSPFDQKQVQPTVTYQYQAPAFEPPPVAPPPAPPAHPQEAPAAMPWETPSAPAAEPAPASSGWDFPPATTAPPEPAYAPSEPFRPAPEPTPMAPSEPVWTPAPKPAEPVTPARTAAPAAAGSWEVVTTTKDSASADAPAAGRKGGRSEAVTDSSWQLASGEAPDEEAEEPEPRRPSGTIVAVAQYAVLVVGLVMVLIGVLVMVANSHVTP